MLTMVCKLSAVGGQWYYDCESSNLDIGYQNRFYPRPFIHFCFFIYVLKIFSATLIQSVNQRFALFGSSDWYFGNDYICPSPAVTTPFTFSSNLLRNDHDPSHPLRCRQDEKAHQDLPLVQENLAPSRPPAPGHRGK